MTVVWKSQQPVTASIMAGKIPIGTVFAGHLSSDGVYLRTYNSIVDLEQPKWTWPVDGPREARVDGYRPLKATLTIEEER